MRSFRPAQPTFSEATALSESISDPSHVVRVRGRGLSTEVGIQDKELECGSSRWESAARENFTQLATVGYYHNGPLNASDALTNVASRLADKLLLYRHAIPARSTAVRRRHRYEYVIDAMPQTAYLTCLHAIDALIAGRVQQNSAASHPSPGRVTVPGAGR
jgi:hypothetical protein